MGIRDFIENMRDGGWKIALNDLSDIVKESSKEFADLRAEGRELFTDGFLEMVIKGNSDYKTSFEKQGDAGERIAKSIKKYERKEKRLRNRSAQLVIALQEHHEYVDGLLTGVLADWRERSKNWGDIRLTDFIQDHEFELEELSLRPEAALATLRRGQAKRLDITSRAPRFKNGQAFSPTLENLQFVSVLSANSFHHAIKQYARVAAADAYLEDAKDFEVEVKARVQAMHEIELKILVVIDRIAEAGALMEEFESHIRELMPRIRMGRKSTNLTPHGLKLAQLTSLSVSAVLKLSRDTVLQPRNTELSQSSRLMKDIRELQKCLGRIH